MIIAVAADHGGFPLKSLVIETIREAGHEVIDMGTHGPESVDYPDYSEKAGNALRRGEVDRAVLLCGSGVGVCIAANKIQGVYAAVCHDTYTAHQGVEHDHMNAICIGARVVGPALAKEIVTSFLSAHFNEEPRFIKRAEKVKRLEGLFLSNPK